MNDDIQVIDKDKDVQTIVSIEPLEQYRVEDEKKLKL